MFLGYEFLHLLTPTGPWVAIPCRYTVCDCCSRSNGHWSLPKLFYWILSPGLWSGCNVFKINAIHFLLKYGRWAGPRYETKRNEYSAPKFNLYYPGASITYLEVYLQFELGGRDCKSFSCLRESLHVVILFHYPASDSSYLAYPTYLPMERFCVVCVLVIDLGFLVFFCCFFFKK